MKKKSGIELDLDGERIVLSDRVTLDDLLKRKKLYDMKTVGKIAGRHYRYLRRLCHAGAIAHHKLLGRYYMTPAQVAELLQPISRAEQD